MKKKLKKYFFTILSLFFVIGSTQHDFSAASSYMGIYSKALKTNTQVFSLYDTATYFVLNPKWDWVGKYGYGSGYPNPYRGHKGIDMGNYSGQPVYAINSGHIRNGSTKDNGGLGIWISIQNGYTSVEYGHLSRWATGLKNGSYVAEGQLIGYLGNTGQSTGPHLHIQIWSNKFNNWIDPYPYVTGEWNISGLKV